MEKTTRGFLCPKTTEDCFCKRACSEWLCPMVAGTDLDENSTRGNFHSEWGRPQTNKWTRWEDPIHNLVTRQDGKQKRMDVLKGFISCTKNWSGHVDDGVSSKVRKGMKKETRSSCGICSFGVRGRREPLVQGAPSSGSNSTFILPLNHLTWNAQKDTYLDIWVRRGLGSGQKLI